MTTTVFCSSNESIIGSLAYDINAILDAWQSAVDNGYGLCENWGSITQAFLNGFDGLCEWLPQSFVTKGFWIYHHGGPYGCMAGTISWLILLLSGGSLRGLHTASPLFREVW